MLDQQYADAGFAQIAQKVGQPLFLEMPQPGCRLVQKQKDRVRAHRTGDLDRSLRSERKIASLVEDVSGETDLLDARQTVEAVRGSRVVYFTAGLPPDAVATLTLDEPGDYAYYCTLHGTTTKGMVGAIRVVG